MSQDIVKRNGVKIVGNGKPVILAPGFALDQSSWAKVCDRLPNKYQLITFDYVGCGVSDHSCYDETKYSTLSGYAQDLVDICAALNLQRAFFVGHSVSSMIGLIASLDQPEFFSKMVFITPSPHYLNEPNEGYQGGLEPSQLDSIISDIDTNYRNWVRTSIPMILQSPEQPELENYLIKTFLKLDNKVAKRFAIATFFSDYRKELLKFKIPSLIVQTRNDMMSPLQVGDYLHAHLDHSTLKVMKAYGHFPQLTNPKEVAEIIDGYLDQE